MRKENSIYEVSYQPFIFMSKKDFSSNFKYNKLLDHFFVLGNFDYNNSGVFIKEAVKRHFENNAITATVEAEKRVEKLEETHNIYLKGAKNIFNDDFEFNPVSEIDRDDVFLSVDSNTDSSIFWSFQSTFVHDLRDFIHYLNEKNRAENNMLFSNNRKNKVETFLLMPIRSYSKQGQFSYVFMTLDIFSNGFAIIKSYIPENRIVINTPLGSRKNYKNQTLKVDSNANEKTVHIENVGELTIDEIIFNKYLKEFSQYVKDGIYTDDSLGVTYLLDHNKADLDYDKLYRLINRPVAEEMKLEEEKVRAFMQNNFTLGQFEIWTSKRGHIVSNIGENPEKDTDLSLFSNFISMEAAIDFPLKIVILNRLNNVNFFNKSLQTNENIENVRQKYLLNRIFISRFTDNFYGSAFDLVSFFNSNLEWYVNESGFKQKNQDLKEIIDNSKIIQEKKTSNYIRNFSFLLTILFGLPALKEILETIYYLAYGSIENMQYEITVKSIIMLLVILVFQAVFFARNKIKNLSRNIKMIWMKQVYKLGYKLRYLISELINKARQ